MGSIWGRAGLTWGRVAPRLNGMSESRARPAPRKQISVRLTRRAIAIARALAERHGFTGRAQAIEYALRAVGRAEGVSDDDH